MTTPSENRCVIDLSTVKYFGELLPRFNGNPNELQTFLIESDHFINQFGTTSNELINRYCFATIKSKLVDQAKTIVYSGPSCDTWTELKHLLNSKFGFKINFDVLQSEYQYMKRRSKESVSEFIDRVKEIKLQYDYQIQLLGLSPLEINVYRNLSDKIGNTVLYNNVDENSRNLLDLQPKPFDDTCKMLENREIKRQQLYLHPTIPTPKTTFSNSNVNPLHTIRKKYTDTDVQVPFYSRQFSSDNRQFTSNRDFPSQPIQLKFNKNPETTFATNSQVFGRPTDVFKPNPNNRSNYPKPEPMSIRTRNYPTKRPASTQIRREPPNNRQVFRRSGPNDFISEELTNTEQTEQEFEDEEEFNFQSENTDSKSDDEYDENFLFVQENKDMT